MSLCGWTLSCLQFWRRGFGILPKGKAIGIKGTELTFFKTKYGKVVVQWKFQTHWRFWWESVGGDWQLHESNKLNCSYYTRESLPRNEIGKNCPLAEQIPQNWGKIALVMESNFNWIRAWSNICSQAVLEKTEKKKQQLKVWEFMNMYNLNSIF